MREQTLCLETTQECEHAASSPTVAPLEEALTPVASGTEMSSQNLPKGSRCHVEHGHRRACWDQHADVPGMICVLDK